MDEQRPQTSSTTVETVEWFDSLPNPVQKPRKKSQLPVAIAAGVIALAIVGVGLWLILNQPKACLTTTDLTELTGLNDVDPVTSPSTYFFSYPVEFDPGMATYNISTEQTGPQIIMKLSDFYKNHPNSSIIMTVSSDYFNTGDDALANKRIALIENDLLAAGIAADSIQTLQPNQNDPENDTEQATTASIAITSAVSCKQ